ncbi:MAG: hypothetical protein ACREQ3_19885, partial [Candidatus Binatia bacterium]
SVAAQRRSRSTRFFPKLNAIALVGEGEGEGVFGPAEAVVPLFLSFPIFLRRRFLECTECCKIMKKE